MAAENIIVYAPCDHTIKIRKWKVREGFQVTNNQVILLYELTEGDDHEIKRLKATKCGVVKKCLYDDGAVVGKKEALLELGACIHTTVIKDMCADCGADLRQDDANCQNISEASVPMVHSVPELKVTKKLAQKLGKADTARLLEDRKLVLLVDLDQTLIHTTNDTIPNNIKGVYHFQLYGPNSPWYHTRLRPGTFHFLSQVSVKYELHICTFGARNYAHMIAQFLDENGKYFSHRILSRDECFNVQSKTDNLSALFPCGDSMVCIIDDREDVWNMASNLIQVRPYHFFQHTGDINAPPGMSKHELDGKGVDFQEILANNAKDDKKKESDENESEIKTPEKMDSPETATTTTTGDTDAEKLNENDKRHDSEQNTDNDKTGDKEMDKKNENQESKPCKSEIKSTNSEVKLAKDDSIKTPNSDSDDNLIEIEDPDDYLLYLETILDKIHTKFYSLYDNNEKVPDLKILIPKMRSEVLVGKVLVFSGLVPNQLKLEQSRTYLIAKALGATVRQQLTDDTTHLVAATAGTFKVNAARKRTEIHIVTPDWLWSCAERWECVDEKVFPLDPSKPMRTRQPPAHCHSPEHVVNYSEMNECTQSNVRPVGPEPKFRDTINPLLKFSNADLAAMNQEFDQFFQSDSSSDSETGGDMENPPSDRKLKKKRKQEDEKEEVQCRKFFKADDEKCVFSTKTTKTTTTTAAATAHKDEDSENDNDDDDANDNDDDENESETGSAESDIEMNSESNSIGSPRNNDDSGDDGEWNMMGAALEREFLGLE